MTRPLTVMAALRSLAFLLLAACSEPGSAPQADQPPAIARFGPPQPVAILGYDDDVMEPFLSRDGATMFFNNRNDPAEQTDLHWATRVDDLTFQYRGRIDSANSSALDGVPTMSADGRFCFISPRAYAETLATVHCGDWRGDRVDGVTLQADASPRIPRRVVFDVELAASGEFAVIVDGLFSGGPLPASADLRLARWRDGALHIDPSADSRFAALNTQALEYGAGLSPDGLVMAFTRTEGRPPFVRSGIWIADRPNAGAPFNPPSRVTSLEGFVEAPTFSPDGQSLYVHHRVGQRFVLERIERYQLPP